MANGDSSGNDTAEVPEHLKNVILGAIKARVGDARCEMCGHTNWTLNTALVSPQFVSWPHKGKSIGIDFARVHPCVMLHCGNCGNSKMHSLHYLGVHIAGVN